MSQIDLRVKAMLGTSHSWAVTMRAIISEMIGQAHTLGLKSINGYEMFPDEWKQYVGHHSCNPDLDLTYTLPRNFRARFDKRSRVKASIYNYESSILPDVWKDSHKHLDYILPSSEFSKKVFVDAGWPEDKCVVVPHGVNKSDFLDKSKVDDIKTKKNFKFLNVSIPHYRKNIFTLLDAYYQEFTSQDDVCLILKTNVNKPKFTFECDVMKEVSKAQAKHRHKSSSLPQVEIITKKYDSIIPLYNSCDCLVSATSSEGFGLPLLEALAANMLVVAPHVTGQADFLSPRNSIQVFSKEVLAPNRYQYWKPTEGAKIFMPSVDSLAESMRLAYTRKDKLASEFSEDMQRTVDKFSWKSAVEKIISLI